MKQRGGGVLKKLDPANMKKDLVAINLAARARLPCPL
jgi:hypothetical protein